VTIDASTFTQSDVRAWCDFLSEYTNDWQGVPVPLGDEMPIVLDPAHPLFEFFRQAKSVVETDDAGLRVVNRWFSRARQCDVFVVESDDGRRSAVTIPVSPDRSMDRLTFWVRTIGACDAWELDSEYRARGTLRAMLTERQWMHYELTGSFFESSPRSGLTYVVRRLRPTIALSPRGRDGSGGEEESMRCLAVLCLHPIGFYSATWAGCMVPSDDVIAHVAWIRGDEAGYWKHANQHARHSAEAGL
jgi:hypothetical protein